MKSYSNIEFRQSDPLPQVGGKSPGHSIFLEKETLVDSRVDVILATNMAQPLSAKPYAVFVVPCKRQNADPGGFLICVTCLMTTNEQQVTLTIDFTPSWAEMIWNNEECLTSVEHWYVTGHAGEFAFDSKSTTQAHRLTKTKNAIRLTFRFVCVNHVFVPARPSSASPSPRTVPAPYRFLVTSPRKTSLPKMRAAFSTA